MVPRELAKVELHCHLSGLLDPTMIAEIEADGGRLPVSREALLSAYPVTSREAFTRWLEVVNPLHGDLENFRRILEIHVGRLKRQNVIYTEIMIGPRELPDDRRALVES